MSEELSYFSEYIKAYNAQSYGGNYMLSPQILNTGLKSLNMLPGGYSEEEITKMVMSPHYYEEQLRKVSFSYFNTVPMYRQMINFMRNMLEFDWNFTPYKLDGTSITASEFRSKKYKDDYAVLSRFFNIFDVKKEFRKVLFNLCMYDTYFTSIRSFEDHVYLQEMPHSHCAIDADSYLGYLYSFDLSYFTNNGVDINAYSPSLKRKYSNALKEAKINYRPNLPSRNGRWVSWIPMNPDDAWVFKFNQEFAGSVPPLLSSLIDCAKLPKYKELEDTKKELENYKVIFSEVPTLNQSKTGQKVDNFAISSTELGKFISSVKDSLKVDYKAAPVTNTKAFDFSPSSGEEDILNRYLTNMAVQMGATSALSLSEGSISVSGAEIYKMFNAKNMENLYEQFATFCEYQINKHTSTYKFKIGFVGNMFDRKERVERANSDMDKGIITTNIFSSRGIQPTDGMNQINMMRSFYGAETLFYPLQSAYTMSSKDTSDKGGAPKKDEVTDEGEKTRDKGSGE